MKDDDAFADQKYLDGWPEFFKNVTVVQHKGANVAPWNLDNYDIRYNNGKVYIDDDPLIFYHFHDLKRISTSFYLTGLNDFSMRLNKAISKHVYIPYIKQINGFGIAMPIKY